MGRPIHGRAISSPAYPRRGSDERQPLIRRRSYDEYEGGPDDVPQAKLLAGGTVLGIHNLAIVFPQLLVGAQYFFTNFHNAHMNHSDGVDRKRDFQVRRCGHDWRSYQRHIPRTQRCRVGFAFWRTVYPNRGGNRTHGSTHAY